MVHSAVDAQQNPPVFRSGIDLRQLDVTALDKNRRPVKGLTQADFTVEEDGVEQKIEAFSFVDVPDTVVAEPAWARTATSDVVSNDLDSARVFAIVVDDVGGMGDLWANREVKKSVATFVGQLGEDDVAAVVFPGLGASSQNFTRDKARLINSVEWVGTRLDTLVGPPGMCEQGRRMPSTMLYVAENLATMKNRRKAIVFLGGSLGFHTFPDMCGIGEIWRQVVTVSNENNISIYPVDTMGLRPRSQIAAESYLSLAHETGGRALINSNAFDEGLAKIYEENASYYLLAYQPTNTVEDGRFRRVVVKVNRPDVEVTSTRSYWAPKPPKPPKTGAAAKVAPPPPEAAALAGVLPLAQLPLRAVAVPFKTDGPAAAVVAVALGLAPPAFGERTRENVDLLIRTFTPDGIDYGSDRQLITVTVPAAPEGQDRSRYEVLARVEVPKPGRYELRFSASSDATGTRGSIYVDVDVPDFEKERLSLSGVVLNALPGVPAGPPRLLAGVMPLTPTTSRTFTRADIVTAFLRLYQGGKDRLAAASLKVQILDREGTRVFDRAEMFGADRFDADRAADYQLRLPLAALESGDYLLMFDATSGKSTSKRDVRFQVR